MKRTHLLHELEQAFKINPVVAILGPRQCGKTTLAREYFTKQKITQEHYFDLEDPLDLERLHDPILTLSDLSELVVIDEIQRIPELFPILRVLVDKKNRKQRFLILGSASRELIQQSSESLAGRIHYIELTPFSFDETHELEKLWLRGGFPLSYLAHSDQGSSQWRKGYIKTFLEQDIPNLGIKIPAQNLRRFWMMVAHYHGQLLNASELGNSLDISYNTVKKYLDILTGTFMIRQLQPWFVNIAKRQVKSIKIYFRDSGIYHSLLNITTRQALFTHPKLGASWEGFALESVIRHMHADQEECYFWATHNQAELDLLIVRGSERLGFEFKHTRSPQKTRSMEIAYENLQLDKIIVIYTGDKKFKLTSYIECIPLEKFLSEGGV